MGRDEPSKSPGERLGDLVDRAVKWLGELLAPAPAPVPVPVRVKPARRPR